MTEAVKKKIFFTFIFVLSLNLLVAEKKTGDLKITESAKGVDFGGHTAVIEESGLVLEKCSNGKLTVSSSVGPGLITLKNCRSITVELESDACLLLDSKTELECLIIKSNALVDSLEFFQAQRQNKKIELKKKAFVKQICIAKEIEPVLRNFDYESKVEIQTEVTSSAEGEKLSIFQDKSFKGLGVRFVIENIPKEATGLNVFLIDDGEEKAIDWLYSLLDKDRFFNNFYEYKYLESGKEYEFIFLYSKEDETLCRYCIKATANKGTEIYIEKENVILSVDEKNGRVIWDSRPRAINLPKNSELVYDIISLDSKNNWHYVGTRSTDFETFDSFNIYRDMKWHFPENVIDNKVFLHVFYRNQSNRWTILVTKEFNLME